MLEAAGTPVAREAATASSAPVLDLPSPTRPRGRLSFPRRLPFPTTRDVALLVGVVAVISLLVKLSWPRFTFWGDNAESFFPLWHMYGESIRAGSPALFQADGWTGGNVIGEAAYGLFNPVVIVNSVLVSLTDRLSLASFLVMTEFLCLFGIGVYLLARSYGARRAAAFVVGVIMPFAGYTLYYEAGNWASGLMSAVWVTWFWWGAHELAAGRRGPLAAIVTGVLAVTVGSPYAVLGILVVLFGLAVESVAKRRWGALGWLVGMGAAVGLAVVAVYIPLLAALPDTVRNGGGAFGNQNYLTPGMGDLLGMSSPSFLPRMNAWYTRWDAVPSTYLSWLILPILPWIRWKSALVGNQLLSVFVGGSVFLLLSLGPQSVWLFQWPIRLIEYTYVAGLVVFAVLITAGLARDHVRQRSIITATVVAATFFVAWASKPELWGWHLLFTAITGAGVACAVIFARRHSTRAIAAVVVLGTALVAPLQTQLFAWDRQEIAPELDQQIPANLSVLRDKGVGFEGTVLQIAALDRLVGTSAVPDGDLSFGNNRAAAGFTTVNRYTGIGFLDFALATGTDYRGSAPTADPIERFFAPLDGYDAPLIQAMGVDTLVVSTILPDFAELSRLTDGWRVIEESPQRVVLRAPWALTTLTPSASIQVADPVEDGARFSFDVTAGSGSVLLPRLAWRGYHATADGDPIEVRKGPAGLLEVVVPAGASHVQVDYEIPGIRAVIGLALLLLTATVLLQLIWWRRRRARRAAETGPEEQAGRLDPALADLSHVPSGTTAVHERP
ncbi:hypothetical protein ACH3VR_10295 [Microbacterium sp. B2969]|uniref:YfhO family protein n=1 Tax=Microbacterium alkaliflavum TaxID=3248839 RepID=A0ABW7Q8N6_9MICO